MQRRCLKMDKNATRYYQKKMHGGQTFLARAIDFVMFRIFIALIIFFIFLFLSHSFIASVLISIFLTIAAGAVLQLVKQRRLRTFIQRDLNRIKEKCLLESLTFMTLKEYSAYLNELIGGFFDVKRCRVGFTAQKDDRKIIAFHNHPLTKIDVNDLLNFLRSCRQPIVIISLSDFNEETKTLCKSMKQEISLISGKQLLELARKKNMLPDEETAERRAEEEMRDTILTIDALKKTVLDKTKARRYIICGVIVLLWSIVTGFRIYYPIIAVLCFVLAVFALKNSRLHTEKTDIDLS